MKEKHRVKFLTGFVAGLFFNLFVFAEVPRSCQFNTGDTLQVFWNANKEADIEGYVLYAGSEIITTQDTILVQFPLITTEYYVTAYDAAGNESEKSESIFAYLIDPFKPRYSVRDLAKYMSVSGTCNRDSTRLGIWSGAYCEIWIDFDKPGVWELALFASAKTPGSYLIVNDQRTAVLSDIAYLHKLRLNFEPGLHIIKISAYGAAYLWNDALILNRLENIPDIDPPEKVTGFGIVVFPKNK